MVASSVARSIVRPIASAVANSDVDGGGGSAPSISFVSSVAGEGPNGGTSGAVNTTTANLILFVVTHYTGSTPVVSDSEGNTWTPLTLSTNAYANVRIYYCYSPTTDVSHTFTVSGVGTYTSFRALAFKDALLAGFDVEAQANAPAATSISSGLLTPTLPNSLFVSAVCLTLETVAPTPPTGFTNFWSPYVTGVAFSVAYKIATDGNAINPAWSWTNANDVGATGAVFKPQS